MVDQLTGSPASSGEAHAVNDVVQTGFQQAQEVVALNASHLFSLNVSVGELTFINTIHVSNSLLFTQLSAVVAQLDALCRSMLTWRISAALQFLACFQNREAQTTGNFPNGSSISCHFNSSLCVLWHIKQQQVQIIDAGCW